MNFIVVTYFFEIIYYSILKYLLAACYKDVGFFSPISIFFSIIETNG